MWQSTDINIGELSYILIDKQIRELSLCNYISLYLQYKLSNWNIEIQFRLRITILV